MAQSVPFFRTENPAAPIKWSKPVTLKTVYFDQNQRSIYCIDTNNWARQCKVDRMDDIQYAHEMFKTLKQAVSAGWKVEFAAAGGFSPDRWFCDIIIDMNNQGE